MKRISFNQNWYCNDQPVTLPHDAQISELRSATASDSGHGYFPGGIYTYQKTFYVPSEWKGKNVLTEFEGVYRNCTVSLNGNVLRTHQYGYTTFTVELEGLRYEQLNTLTVVADNSQLPNSRWYTGSGIYRPVWLYVGEESGIAYRGVKITTCSINPAVIRVEITAGSRPEIEILDETGVIASGTGDVCELTIPQAKLWRDETPYLYTCRVTAAGDTVEDKFGIRQITWNKRGLFINGVETKLRGGCVHHDHGVVGAAAYDESEWRRVRILKDAGFNAIRSSHNPASRAMLEACDYYGMYLIDEAFDMWYNRKTKYDYGNDFENCWREDVTEMVARDFNHPSVILYSIGNEVAEPCEEKGVRTGKEMIALIHRMDASRPVTAGLNLMIISRASKGKGIYQDGEMNASASGGKKGSKREKNQNASLMFNMIASVVGTSMNKAGNSVKVDALTSPMIDALDIAGYNYGSGRYPLEGNKHPERIIFGSETFPQDIGKNWEMVKKYPYLIGDFMWTAWDYLGEAGLGAWSYDGGMPFNRPYPWLLGGAGVIDITGRPDGSCRYASAVWGIEKNPRLAVKPANHPGVRPSKSTWRGTNAIESWSWQGCEGNKTEVEVYSQAPMVGLFCNGKLIGRKKTRLCHASFFTRYSEGILTAVAYDEGGREVGQSNLRSASGPFCLKIYPEKQTACPGEVVYLPVEITGSNGVVESNADEKINVSVSGGELLGFGSGNPCTEERYQDGCFTTYYGRALAVIRCGNHSVTVKVKGKTLAEVCTEISVVRKADEETETIQQAVSNVEV